MKRWRWVRGHRGSYRVSNHGDVKSVTRKKTHTRNGTKITKTYQGRTLKLGHRNDPDQYTTAILHKGKRQITYSVHRLVAEAFIPNPRNLPEVNHKDLNKKNNQADNLEWCTSKGNKQHRIQNGVHFIGELNPGAKLNWRKVRKIRKLHGRGITQTELAKRFKVSIPAVCRIVHHKVWREDKMERLLLRKVGR